MNKMFPSEPVSREVHMLKGWHWFIFVGTDITCEFCFTPFERALGIECFPMVELVEL